MFLNNEAPCDNDCVNVLRKLWTILEVTSNDGAVVGMFSLPSISQHLVFDGEHLWVAIGDKLISFDLATE
jgi:hypothetical protein